MNYEMCIKSCKEIEALLFEKYGASGRGMHEKVSSVAGYLSNALITKLRFSASIRNKLLHENGFSISDLPDGFERTCQEVILELGNSSGGNKFHLGAAVNCSARVISVQSPKELFVRILERPSRYLTSRGRLVFPEMN